ncbi:Endoribonuclease Dicer like 1 [Dissostichus eleginoides]|uniref:Endoribonuclease Dicer like 1 n=1 Tax=Dissostichus eleginoides TaxID=100907 RepID=A0AAD9B727_DISEL|nr:Endoribonuclease Dicer like 1 [Dissostichus eleginoides]
MLCTKRIRLFVPSGPALQTLLRLEACMGALVSGGWTHVEPLHNRRHFNKGLQLQEAPWWGQSHYTDLSPVTQVPSRRSPRAGPLVEILSRKEPVASEQLLVFVDRFPRPYFGKHSF